MSTTTTAPAGWYPNPLDAATQRWWDGVSWTEHVSPELPTVQKTVEATLVPAIPSVPWAQTGASRGGAAYPGTGYARIGSPGSPYQGTPASWSTTVQSPNTVWIWLLAFGPYISAVAIGVAQGVLLGIGMAAVGGGSPPAAMGLLGLVIGMVPVWVFAGLDIRSLRQRGYQTASILFMLLVPPLVYFAARARKLKRDGVRSRGPEIAFLIVVAVYIGTAIIGAIIGGAMLAPLL